MIVEFERDFEGDPERDGKLKENFRKNSDERNLVFSCLLYLARKLQKVGKFSHSKDWRTIQKEWNENADPLDEFVSNYIIDSEHRKTKRDTYHFYKEIMYEKGERPMGIGRFGKLFSEYHDGSKEKIDGKSQWCWLNIDFKRPVQTKMKDFDIKTESFADD